MCSGVFLEVASHYISIRMANKPMTILNADKDAEKLDHSYFADVI